jgi:CheY-like chemotaxis protein
MSDCDNSTSVETRCTVLYIEDDLVNIKLMLDIFSEFLPYDFISATNAEDGISMAKEHEPNLILMDINMAGMGGYQALAVMKDDAELEKIPVIAISGDTMPEHLEKALAAGFIDYIFKPFNIMEFVETIKQHLS